MLHQDTTDYYIPSCILPYIVPGRLCKSDPFLSSGFITGIVVFPLTCLDVRGFSIRSISGYDTHVLTLAQQQLLRSDVARYHRPRTTKKATQNRDLITAVTGPGPGHY